MFYCALLLQSYNYAFSLSMQMYITSLNFVVLLLTIRMYLVLHDLIQCILFSFLNPFLVIFSIRKYMQLIRFLYLKYLMLHNEQVCNIVALYIFVILMSKTAILEIYALYLMFAIYNV